MERSWGGARENHISIFSCPESEKKLVWKTKGNSTDILTLHKASRVWNEAWPSPLQHDAPQVKKQNKVLTRKNGVC